MIDATHAAGLRSAIRIAGVSCQIEGGPIFPAFLGPVEELDEGQTRELHAKVSDLPNPSEPPQYGTKVQTPDGEYTIESAEYNYGLLIAILT